MVFIDRFGRLLKGRLGSSGEDQALETGLNQNKLHELIRAIHKRLKGLESRVQPEAIEFEQVVDATGTTVYYFNHNFGGPVRFYVTHWTRPDGGAYPTSGPNIVAVADSDSNRLAVTSTVAGKAVVRVEPSQFYVGI